MIPTVLSDVDPRTPTALEAALETGQTIIFPTDTIYGMGGNPWDEGVVAKVGRLKGRATDQPYTLHLAALADIDRYAVVRPGLRPILARLLPGPYTVILPPQPAAPPCSVSSIGVGLRVPNHRLFGDVLASLRRPLFGTSVNEHGQPPLRDVDAMIDRFPSVDLIIVGAVAGEPSGILDLTGPEPRALRGCVPPFLVGEPRHP